MSVLHGRALQRALLPPLWSAPIGGLVELSLRWARQRSEAWFFFVSFGGDIYTL
jgi:hypothetical protein